MSIVIEQDILSSDPVEGLQRAWSEPKLALFEKARIIARLHAKSRMTLEGTARMTGATQAQIQALLDLATLDDEELRMVSDANPPSTTWFLFAAAEGSAIKAGIDALPTSEDSEPAVVAVYDAMKAVMGPDQDERIAAISSKTIGHLASKAKQFDKLRPQDRKFLVQMSILKNRDGSMSPGQLSYLKGLLLKLCTEGVVTRNSLDNDQVHCDEVLDALGM